MSDPDIKLDLKGLQSRLDSLEAGQQLAIALMTYRRLFGVDDAAPHRAEHFARGHHCTIQFQDSVIVFRKSRSAPPRVRHRD